MVAHFTFSVVSRLQKVQNKTSESLELDFRKFRTRLQKVQNQTSESSELCSETGFQNMQMWSCATSSLRSSLVTGPCQNRVQTVCVNYLSQLLLWLIVCLSLWPHCVHFPGSFVLYTCRYFVSPMLKQKPLASTVSLSLTVLWSGGVISLLTSPLSLSLPPLHPPTPPPSLFPIYICHIQSSHTFKTWLKTKLKNPTINVYNINKQYHSNWFEITFSSFYPSPLSLQLLPTISRISVWSL